MSYRSIKSSDGSYVRYYDNGDIRDESGCLLGYVKDNGYIVSKSDSIESGYIKDGVVRTNNGTRQGIIKNGSYYGDDGSYSTEK